MARLIVRFPDNVIQEVEFDQPKYKIGRAEDNDLVLDNDEVEAHQAEIETSNGTYQIIDVSESKSTTINGKKFELEFCNERCASDFYLEQLRKLEGQ